MNNKPIYNPQLHHRRSIRLKGYDYSRQGLFFVTLCVNKRTCLFGEIIKEQLVLNDAGAMVNKWYHQLENKYPDIKCHEHIVMPNHFHCIVENAGNPVGEDLRVCPNNKSLPVDAPFSNAKWGGHAVPPQQGPPISGEHAGSPLSRVIQWFKTMSTNEYIRNVKTNNWARFNDKLWQRNYWEHIIRNEKAYHMISEYIISNPKNWNNDSINPNNTMKKEQQ